MKPKQPKRKDPKPNDASGKVESKSKYESIGYVCFDGAKVVSVYTDETGNKWLILEYA